MKIKIVGAIIMLRVSINNDKNLNLLRVVHQSGVTSVWALLDMRDSDQQVTYYRDRNNYQYHFEVHSRYHRP